MTEYVCLCLWRCMHACVYGHVCKCVWVFVHIQYGVCARPVCVCAWRCVAFFYHSMSSSLWRAVLLQIHAKSRYSPADSHMSINTPPSCDWTRVRGKGCFDLANNVVMVNALTRGHQTR